jgi:hypothetical protein
MAKRCASSCVKLDQLEPGFGAEDRKTRTGGSSSWPTSRMNSSMSRLFPMPAAPTSVTARHCPSDLTAPSACRRVASSRPRPKKGAGISSVGSNFGPTVDSIPPINVPSRGRMFASFP